MPDNVQYTNAKVQQEDFTSGWKVAFILTALGVSLPMLYLGSEMALAMGFKNAIIAFGISTTVLTALCLVTTIIGTRSRLSTYMLLRFPFGKKGAMIINFIMGISLLGWFSVALELLSEAIGDAFQIMLGIDIPLWSIILIGSSFITMTTIYGIRVLENLANISVPILLLFLIYVVYIAYTHSSLEIVAAADVSPLTLFEGTSALIGSSILVPVLMADFSRYIHNDKQSLLSVLGITIGTPLVWIIAAILAVKTGQVDIIQMMKSYQLVLPAIILIFVTTWVTNATNLYSVSLTLATLSSRFNYTKLTIISSLLGTSLALGGFSNYFIDFLNILSIFAPSIAAIYIIDFFLVRKQQYILEEIEDWGEFALCAWAISSIYALSTYFDIFHLSGAYFVDSFLIGGMLYLIFNYKKLTSKT